MSNNTMVQVYLLAQEHCGLKVGDWVRIIRAAENYEAGWDNVWVNDDIDTSQSYKIFSMNTRGIYLDCKKYGIRRFPYFILEKVDKPEHQFKPFDKVLVRDEDDEKWKPQIFSCYVDDGIHIYYTLAEDSYAQCIPYEGNEHLVGTTDMPE